MKLPYGYRINEGKTVTVESEIQIVREIYISYINDCSLSTIASNLNKRKVPLDDDCQWNKSKIKRILEDARYLGNVEYEPTIDSEFYERVQRIKAERNTYKKPTEPQAYRLIEDKIICMDCGSSYIRNQNYFICENGCPTDEPLSSQKLTAIARKTISTIKSDPSLMDANHSDVMSMKILKLNSDINRALEKSVIDEDEVTSLILECAQEKYYEIPDTIIHYKDLICNHTTEEILRTNIPAKIIEGTYIHHDLSATVKLENGKIIEVDYEENACRDNKRK